MDGFWSCPASNDSIRRIFEFNMSSNGDQVPAISVPVSQNTKILITIVVLVLLYLLSKFLRSWNEAGHDLSSSSRVGNTGDGATHHHWHYSDLIIHPIHCNVCHTLLLTTKGKRTAHFTVNAFKTAGFFRPVLLQLRNWVLPQPQLRPEGRLRSYLQRNIVLKWSVGVTIQTSLDIR